MLRFLLPLLFLCFMFLSCNREAERGDFFECFVDGEKFRFTNLSAYAAYDASAGAYTIYGTEALDKPENPQSIYMVLNGDFGPGTYSLGRGEDGNGYYINEDQTFTYFTLDKDGTGTLEITSKDDNSVKGTFSFVAIDPQANKSVDVTEGKFDVSFR